MLTEIMAVKKIINNIDEKFKKDVIAAIKKSKSIVVTSHIHPDSDSMASVLSTYYYIVDYLGMKDKVRIIYSATKTDKWTYFKYFDKIEFVENIYDCLDKCDLLIILDASGWNRISFSEKKKEYEFKIVCLDHHPKPDDIFDYHLVNNHFAATSEIIYRLFYEKEKLQKELCEILLMGIYSDTGNFTYLKSSNLDVLDVVKRLIKEGSVNVEKLERETSKIKWIEFKLVSLMMSNSKVLGIKGWPKLVASTLSKSEIKKLGANSADTNLARNWFYDYLKSFEEYDWGILVYSDGDFCKISGRSLPNSVSIRKIMEGMGIGGGHDRAASGIVKVKDVTEALNMFLEWLKNNKPVII